jgi:hypothetical protein
MHSRTGEDRAPAPLRDRLRELLHDPALLGPDALLEALATEVAERETRAYAAGWRDAIASSRSGRPLPQSRPGAS